MNKKNEQDRILDWIQSHPFLKTHSENYLTARVRRLITLILFRNFIRATQSFHKKFKIYTLSKSAMWRLLIHI